MKDQNKPEWLLKAEQEQAKFNETKVGKMNQKEFEFYERQSNAGKSAYLGETGIWNMDPTSKKEAERKGGKTGASGKKQVQDGTYKKRAIAGGKKQGPIQGRKNVESGHWAKLSKLGAAATAKKNKEIRLKRYSEILPEISNDWITRKELAFGLCKVLFVKNGI